MATDATAAVSEEPNDEKPETSSESYAVTLPERKLQCAEFAKKTGFSLTVGANVRKYGGMNDFFVGGMFFESPWNSSINQSNDNDNDNV